MKVETPLGAFTISVDTVLNPSGTNRFYRLVEGRFYDGKHFKNVVREGFIAHDSQRQPPDVDWSNPTSAVPLDGHLRYFASGVPRRIRFYLADEANRKKNNEFGAVGEVTAGMEIADLLCDIRDAGSESLPDNSPYLERAKPGLAIIQRMTIQSAKD